MANICGICCETYNKSTHSKVSCEYADCKYDACKACVRMYLTSTTQDPNCMNCKKTWSEEFLVKNLNKVFCEKEYKQHRKNLLLDREMSKMPETMAFAEQQKKIQVQQQHISEVDIEIRELNKKLKELQRTKATFNNTIYHIRHGIDDNENSQAERKKFIMSCPHDGCRGFLSTQYKCELCEMFSCPHCLEVIGISKDIPHTCNPDNVASAEFIKKDTKPCPQCGTRIHKIHGCNQMWCIQCHVAFNWENGKIDSSGHIHNPEYYRFLQQQGNGAAPRNPGDIICGGLIGATDINRTIFPIIQHAIYKIYESEFDSEKETEFITLRDYISNINRILSHITFRELPLTRQKVRDNEDHRDIRADYILGKITRDQLKDKVYASDFTRKQQVELLHLYELLNVVGIETFNTIYQKCREAIPPARQAHNNKNVFTTKESAEQFMDDINKQIVQIDNLRDYCNKRFAKISVAYNKKIINITDLWEIESKKYKQSELTED